MITFNEYVNRKNESIIPFMGPSVSILDQSLNVTEKDGRGEVRGKIAVKTSEYDLAVDFNAKLNKSPKNTWIVTNPKFDIQVDGKYQQVNSVANEIKRKLKPLIEKKVNQIK